MAMNNNGYACHSSAADCGYPQDGRRARAAPARAASVMGARQSRGLLGPRPFRHPRLLVEGDAVWLLHQAKSPP